MGLEFCRLLALGLGWLEATSCGALRLSRHRSRGLTTGYAIRCHPNTSGGGTYDSVLVGPQLQGVAMGELGIILFCSPGFCGVGCLFARAFLLGRLIYIIIVPHGFMSHVPCNPAAPKKSQNSGIHAGIRGFRIRISSAQRPASALPGRNSHAHHATVVAHSSVAHTCWTNRPWR